jgi:hypothetical protein
VDVEATQWRQIQDWLREQLAVGRDNDHVRLERGQFVLHLLFTETGRLDHVETMFNGIVFDWRRLGLTASAGGAVRRGVDAHNLTAFHADKTSKNGDGKGWGAHENKTHGVKYLFDYY